MVAISRKIQFLTFSCILAGCTSIQPSAGDNWIGFTESGQASFYADRYQNRKTASGDLYKHNQKTAAHRDLPFGSNVKVTNTNNGKSVIVKINDRGPFVKGRIIDLSKSAFSSIGNISNGVINVKIEIAR
ncbi:septal ring lytic transglycosylase RlpA family protein [Shewanella psychromarinicola]|uniref:Endolytic peptidoglycan transglycosylase RlpA n=1 Tax=Shewanella psychromarinicola TaxID=2487742 RepID=A0A3N4E2S8_9GAMM|nr:septal ring lytic transglycosylase RlpA family protein [Shewanella psychromarinicola]AZG34400.1 septal ring lytic transglycosylase RlpA family protein [Shewanella psychromarinicola]MCL1082049.1 septal ring lytic transglycosylase RlpA family protein [Shewanella psychromarinicola]RPA32499.1 septal ring lytic transglycosylase RlpA family protein [Shewanella psychromarinicola]